MAKSVLPLLFLSMDDVYDTWGAMHAVATDFVDITPSSRLASLPRLLAAFDPNPRHPSSGYELFYQLNQSIYYATSHDLREISEPMLVATLPINSTTVGSCIPKTLGRNDDGSRYVTLQYCENRANFSTRRLTEGLRALVATDPLSSAGGKEPFRPKTPDVVAYHDHDDQQLIYDGDRQRWVASQVTFQNHTTFNNNTQKKYCDNAGCIFRRILSTRSSEDGLHWSNSSACNETFHGDVTRGQESYCTVPGGWNATGMLVPDQLDPPELEFYKLTMFWVGTGRARRLLGHALLYAPAPMQELGIHYGLMNNGTSCGGTAGLRTCHGPHMYIERMVGPQSNDPTNFPKWKRPFRTARVAPRDELLSVGPLTWPPLSAPSSMRVGLKYAQYHAWTALPKAVSTLSTGSAGSPPLRLLGIPAGRFAGIYAPANGEFSTQPFSWPASGLTLNADVHWGARTPSGGCDENCQAYVMVAVVNATDNQVVRGYERGRCVLYDIDGLELPLDWKADSNDPDTAPSIVAGTPVRLRVSFRDAIVYGVGVGVGVGVGDGGGDGIR